MIIVDIILHHKAIKETIKFKGFKNRTDVYQNIYVIRTHLAKLVEVKIVNVENSSYKIINTLVVPLICNPLSDQCVSIAKNQYDHLKYLKLSDSSDSKFNCNVDILIGADYYWDFVSGNTRRGNSGLVAAEIILRCVLSETYEFENNIYATVNLSSTHVLKISVQESDIDYDSCFQTFWHIESSETRAKGFSDYSKHVYFNGRKYETPLPRKKRELIPDNYALRESHLYSLIKRLKRDPVTLQEHDSILKKQEFEGITEEPPGKIKPAGTVHYLPHHLVIRTDKSTSRVRIVHDASVKRNGPSLNHCLETGPNTLPQIIDILLRLRLNKIALISDIKQAFLSFNTRVR